MLQEPNWKFGINLNFKNVLKDYKSDTYHKIDDRLEDYEFMLIDIIQGIKDKIRREYERN